MLRVLARGGAGGGGCFDASYEECRGRVLLETFECDVHMSPMVVCNMYTCHQWCCVSYTRGLTVCVGAGTAAFKEIVARRWGRDEVGCGWVMMMMMMMMLLLLLLHHDEAS